MSWEELKAIVDEAREEQETGLDMGDIACPNDGEPLLIGPDGGLYCPFDGWRPSVH